MTMNENNPINTPDENLNPTKIPKKTHWNIYSLQKLSIGKFIKVLDKVFRNEFKLTK
jgi:hypothetical protein